MKIFKSKNNIKENKIIFKKGLSVIGGSVKKDWMFLVSFFGVALVGLLIFSWSIFKEVKNDSFLSEENTQTTNSLRVNTEQLEKVVENLNSRKEQFERLTKDEFEETRETEEEELLDQ